MNIFEYVKSKIAILDVISEYVTLKPAGRYWKGPSPFQHERVPSFTVSPHKEIYYCFSSGQGGDVISFIASIENCTQLEALHYLIDRYKIQVPATIEWNKSSPEDINKKTMYEKTCTFFANWCSSMLSHNQIAQNYLAQRSISPDSIRKFTIGYCPQDETSLKNLLDSAHKNNILLQDFFDTQILKEQSQLGHSKTLYVPFGDRIIFPIYNHLGNCCGFGGRVFKENDTRAKYYNSHEHEYFNKGTIIFGLNNAKKTIQQTGHAFLVEGYVDCVAMAQAGYTNTIATLGTACTLDHLKQIARYAHKLYIMYDGDAAGQKAVVRLAELCWQVNLELFVVTLPQNDDPASFLAHQQDLEPFIAKARDIFQFFIEHASQQFFSKNLQERLLTINQLLETIAQLADPLQKDLLLHKMATTFDTSIETLNSHIRKKKVQIVDFGEKAVSHNHQNSLPPLEKKLFSVILTDDTLSLAQDDEIFLLEHMSPPLAQLLKQYRNHSYQFHSFFDALSEEEQKLVSNITVEYGQEASSALFRKLLDEFHKQQWKLRVHDVKIKLAQHSNASTAEQEKILMEFQELKKNTLRKNKGTL